MVEGVKVEHQPVAADLSQQICDVLNGIGTARLHCCFATCLLPAYTIKDVVYLLT